MEQIRVIKEMREHDRTNGRSNEYIRPRYMVWENVPGAFSSNKGEDFRAVLEETAKVADKAAVIPRPSDGKWSSSGCIVGDGWSIAWRVHDAQFWGVPQRRKRIALVADFGGNTAPEILFERKSVSGDFEQSREKGKDFTRRITESPDTTGVWCIGGQSNDLATPSDNVSKTLNCMVDTMKIVCFGLDRASFNQGKNAQYDFSIEDNLAQTLVAKGVGGGNDSTVGALCARDYKGVGTQYVSEGKCIVQSIGKPPRR